MIGRVIGRVIGPGELADSLGALEVSVEEAHVRLGWVCMPDYPGERRPTSIVELRGKGHSGFGENVAFTLEEHAAFAARLRQSVRAATHAVNAHLRTLSGLYELAAIEAALVDLALRQHGMGLADLCGRSQARLRWVASFAAREDPVSHVQHVRSRCGRVQLKIDVEPQWTDATLAALAAEGGIVVLDCKGRGDPGLVERLVRAFPGAVIEDPPPGAHPAQVARDAPLANAAQVAAALAQGCRANIKAPRMGGPLEALRALAHGASRCYFGGMHEAGPGREQARQLAALFCPDSPNDLAPLAGGASSMGGDSPSSVRLDGIGFGATFDWSKTPAVVAFAAFAAFADQ